MTHELFSYDEADAILRRDGANDYVGISAIDGLIAAVVAGPAAMTGTIRVAARGFWKNPSANAGNATAPAHADGPASPRRSQGDSGATPARLSSHFHAGSRADLHRGLDDWIHAWRRHARQSMDKDSDFKF